MSLFNFSNGTIMIEARTLFPERFINALWKNQISVKKLVRVDISTVNMEIYINDYDAIKKIADENKAKIKVVGGEGIYFYYMRAKKKASLITGIVIFFAGLFYLSSFVWTINIVPDKYISPYEIRQMLNKCNIRPGIMKKDIDVYSIEGKMVKLNDNIMWVKARIEGSRLTVQVSERTEPPSINKNTNPCNIIASMDGEVDKVYTTSGTAIVKEGDIVTKGQVLIKGEQGKEGSTYTVHADGEVMAKTFYEYNRKVLMKGVKYVPTGKTLENKYITVFGKKIYLKKSLNKFATYDTIEEDKGTVKSLIYRETKPVEYSIDKDTLMEQAEQDYYKTTEEKLDKSAKVIDTIKTSEEQGDSLNIKIVFVVRQSIGIEDTQPN
ncbi:sporulation protein YqfD [Clostridium sp. 19966]|uniref:sporulation protein YqfD n=1 Tax=Clostridium sp. 19966 TaxID=2768166 RepID=UPI0028DEB2AB|nr:sporulation protein YqfD [Clostridium sp. 19966]MDT8715317.1 sporulation protein YqfD [Clostridium sp. 19966]